MYNFQAEVEEYATSEPVTEGLETYQEETVKSNSPYKDHSGPPPYGSIKDAPTSLTIELPRADFTEVALENLKGLIESKETLIKKALGVDYLPVLACEETISFPWFHGELKPDEIKAYTHFIVALADMAKKQKRVNATERTIENEKYAFRCFLLRLGFIGSEYRLERKILLSKLTGNSAFKNGQPANEEASK